MTIALASQPLHQLGQRTLGHPGEVAAGALHGPAQRAGADPAVELDGQAPHRTGDRAGAVGELRGVAVLHAPHPARPGRRAAGPKVTR